MLSFAAPAFLWALLAVPGVILLHFMRVQRRRQDVSALFLWRRAREMAEAQRRFSPTWLLLLQILAVTAGALALARPQLSFQPEPDVVIVLDASASMAAVGGDGRSRLEAAAEQAADVVRASGRTAVVRAGREPVVVHPFTEVGGDALAAVSGVVAADRDVDLDRALDLAFDVASGGTVHVFTDADVSPRAGLVVHTIGSEVRNLGIVAFDVGLQDAFIAVASNLARPQEVQLELLREGEPVASTTLFVPAGGQQATVTFPLMEGGIYEARLRAPEWDALGLDDVAYAGRREITAVLDEPIGPLERALAALPATSARVTAQAAGVPAEVKVLTVDAVADDALEGLEPGSYILVPPRVEDPTYRAVADFDRTHPVMRFADVRESVVGVGDAWEAPTGPAWEVLARDAELTPLLLYGEREGVRALVLAFHPSQTDMVLRPAFPTMIANAMRAFRGDERIPLGARLPEGATLDGRPVDRALRPGVYMLGERARPASLLSSAETAVPAPPPAQDAAGPPTAVTDERRPAAHDLGAWLVLLAALALIAEWWLSRRSSWWALRGT